MGSEDLFHKRKAKNIASLERKKARRKIYNKVLIVCEGEKTEPLYINDLKDFYEINSANIEIIGDCESCPKAIVEFARKKYTEEKKSGDPFDKVFCVFDKDSHYHYLAALQIIEQSKPANTFVAINSIPCFEYWLLLHFIYSTRPYTSLPNNSAGNQIFTELRNYINNYSKGKTGIFNDLAPNSEQAKAFAIRSLAEAERVNTDNPTTKMHLLVEFLQNIKKQKD